MQENTLLSTAASAVGLGKLLSAGKILDQATGGNAEQFFRTAQHDFLAALDEDARTSLIELASQVRTNEVALQVVLELMSEIHSAQDALERRWNDRDDKTGRAQRPSDADVVHLACVAASGYRARVGPKQRALLVDALRGAFDPDTFLWGMQDELLERLMRARLNHEDIEQLRELGQHPSQIRIEQEPRFSRIERLAAQDFVQLRVEAKGGSTYIRHRTELQTPAKEVKVSRTLYGARLLKLLDAGARLR